jgi:hypothetical protein
MKCPNCAANIPALSALNARAGLLKCGACKRQLHVKGLLTCFIIFMVLSSFVGFPYPDNITLLMILVLVEMIGLYTILFYICVELVVVDEMEKAKE